MQSPSFRENPIVIQILGWYLWVRHNGFLLYKDTPVPYPQYYPYHTHPYLYIGVSHLEDQILPPLFTDDMNTPLPFTNPKALEIRDFKVELWIL